MLAPIAPRTTGQALRIWLLALSVIGAVIDPAEASRIDPRLARAVSNARSGSEVATIETPATVLSRLEFRSPGAAGDFAARAREVGGASLPEQRGAVVWLRADRTTLEQLAHEPELLYATLPFTPVTTHQTQALSEMRVPTVHANGYRGQGVRVGVIDVSFQGYGPLLGSELPTSVTARSFYDGANGNGNINGNGSRHGTACAEVIHDVAPEAELYFAAVANDLDLERAVDWMIDQGVEVISHSLAWFVGGGDGQGPINQIVSRAHRAGILWVTSAGNFAEQHWGGTFSDTDGDALLEFAPNDEAIEFTGASIGQNANFALYWNRWPLSEDLAFAIELRNAAGDLLATTETEFADYPYAFRSLDYTPPDGGRSPRLSIRRLRGNADGVHLQLFRIDGDLPENGIAAGSLSVPADSPEALSVGAYGYRAAANQEALQAYSSQGPTVDGRAKPELLGPDGVDTSIFNSFSGTSAACPHVSGAVALLLSAAIEGGLHDARLSPTAIRALLRNEALPLVAGTRQTDAEGWGRVRLVLDRPTNRSGLVFVPPGTTTGGSARGIEGPYFLLRQPADPERAAITIYDVQGRAQAHLAPAPGLLTFAPDPDGPPGLAFVLDTSFRAPRGRYWARERSTGATVAFGWPGSR
ncbi:MAG: S8 family serine peptidase [Candidatus Eisenbacteria bacterium]|nr:S8 family serine peptidase [Candidatus Eisenbacteria bacterium]